MTKYILSRTLRSVFTVIVVFVAVFMLLRLMPLSGYFPQEMLKETDEAIHALKTETAARLCELLAPVWTSNLNRFYEEHRERELFGDY